MVVIDSRDSVTKTRLAMVRWFDGVGWSDGWKKQVTACLVTLSKSNLG